MIISSTFLSRTTIFFVIFLPMVVFSLRRCYSCRSRGEKGDCRDPFKRPPTLEPGAPIESHSRYVDELPCSSGWCLKVMEGVDKNFGDEDHGIATERACMPRVPSDGKERCAYVKRNHRQVFMCFCKGDLCNSGLSVGPSWMVAIIMCLFLMGIFCDS